MANVYDQFDRQQANVFDQFDEPQRKAGFSPVEMVKNIPGSVGSVLGDVYNAVRHPVDTIESLGGLAQSVGNKVGRNAAELVQGVDMEPMPEYSEDAANAVGQFYKDRYGSVDAALNTLESDPAGMALDVSGVGMSSRIPGVAKVAASVEPLTVAARTAKAVAKNVIPKDAAQKLYQSAAKFSTTLKPEKRQSMIQTALDNGFMPTSKGVAAVEGRLSILNHQLDELIRGATESGQKIPVNAIFQHLHELRKSKGGVKIEADSDLAAINKIAGEFHNSLKGRKSLTPEEVQAFKVDAYNKINWDAKRMAGSPIKEDTFKALARGAKDSIANALKDAPEINKALAELYELQPHLTRAANRIDNRNLLSINTPLNVGAGGLMGSALGSGAAGISAGVITAALGNPKVKARIAIVLNKLKQGDVNWIQENIGRQEVIVALALAGRNEEMLNGQ